MKYDIPDGWMKIAKTGISEMRAKSPVIDIFCIKELNGELKIYFIDNVEFFDTSFAIAERCRKRSKKTCAICGTELSLSSPSSSLPLCESCKPSPSPSSEE